MKNIAPISRHSNSHTAALVIVFMISSILVYAGWAEEDISLTVVPQESYTATYCNTILFKYDLAISNKSQSPITLDSIVVSFFDVSGVQIAGPYNFPASTIAQTYTYLIMSLANLEDDISADDFLYFNMPFFKIDNIDYENNYTIPQNSKIIILFPIEQLRFSLDIRRIEVTLSGLINGGVPISLSAIIFPTPYVTSREYQLPIHGRLYVSQGSGLNSEHRRSGIVDVKNTELILTNPVRFGLDFVMVDQQGKEYQENGYRNEDYYCWDKPVLAVEGGLVAAVISNEPDNPKPGSPPLPNQMGNGVIINHGNNEFSLYQHLRQYSTSIKKGDVVARGQEIGRVGNSGTNQPHLHYMLVHDPSEYLPKMPPFGGGSAVWEVLPEGIPSIFNGFYLGGNAQRVYIPSGTIDNRVFIEQNLPPVIDMIPDQNVREGMELILPITVSDPNGDDIQLTAQNMPPFASMTRDESGIFRIIFLPESMVSGLYANIKIIARDPAGATSEICFNLIVEPTVISISLEGSDWILQGVKLGSDIFNTIDGTRYSRALHSIRNTGDIDVDVAMTYAGFEGLEPSMNDLTDHFTTSVALVTGHLITIQPPDSTYPAAIILKGLKGGEISPLLVHYTAPTQLTKPVSRMKAVYELRAYEHIE